MDFLGKKQPLCVSERGFITSFGRVQLGCSILLFCLFAATFFEQAQAAGRTNSRTYRYSHLTITRSLTQEAIYRLRFADGSETAVSAMPDIGKHMHSLIREQKADGIALKLEGFSDRPDDVKALLFSLRNASGTGAMPFLLSEDSKLPSDEVSVPTPPSYAGTYPTAPSQKQGVTHEAKPDLAQKSPRLEYPLPAVYLLAIKEPINGLYIAKKTGAIIREERPYSSATRDSYVQHAQLHDLFNNREIEIVFRSPTLAKLSFLVDRFLAILNELYLDIFAAAPNSIPVLTSKNHVDAVRIAKKRLAIELGMSDDELSKEIRVEIGNTQIAVLDLANIME